ncbi:glycosyltransferase [Enterobacteriaceae bacterium RIT702]|nr:glycosyltransferase [Enterobacteriaceae bacterium RIT702]
MKITALVVTFNRLDKLKKCWAAIEQLSFHQVVIVDNASTDGTYEWLSKVQDPRLVILQNENNEGGAGGFLLGSEWIANNTKSDWVLIFDDDAYPEKNILDNFIVSDKRNAKVIASNVYDLNGSRCKMNIPWVKIPNNIYDVLLYKKKPFLYEANKEGYSEIITFSFVGVFIDFETLKHSYSEIKKELFIYFDDVYYSWSLKNLGCKMIYNPELIFHHDVVESTSAILPWKIYYLARNLILSRKIFPSEPPFSILSIILRLSKYIYMVKKSNNKIVYLKSLFKGMIDGVKYNFKGKVNGN